MPERKTVNGLGERLRARREALGLTLRALGAQVGLSASFLAQVERSLANPSIESLQQIAAVLKVPIFYFFTEERAPERVVRADGRKQLRLPDSHITYELLHPTLSHKSLGLLIRLGAGDHIHPIRLSEPTEEWLLVVAGRVQIRVAGETYELALGDSIAYEGWELEGVTALGTEEVVLVGGMTPPAF
ncbi:MAG: helix-turn-helix domain-containing protein [Anaerolineales bacterium]|nr:helix-turn-helix domain-containing protein [Anaerolineales bacterium]